MTPVEVFLAVALIAQSICWIATDFRRFTG